MRFSFVRGVLLVKLHRNFEICTFLLRKICEFVEFFTQKISKIYTFALKLLELFSCHFNMCCGCSFVLFYINSIYLVFYLVDLSVQFTILTKSLCYSNIYVSHTRHSYTFCTAIMMTVEVMVCRGIGDSNFHVYASPDVVTFVLNNTHFLYCVLFFLPPAANSNV